MKTPRAVLDANIFISALITPSGFSGRIVHALLLKNAFTLVYSQPILAELRLVLKYPKLKKYFKFSPTEIEQLLTSLEVLGESVDPIPLTIKALRDPKDLIYIEAALSANCPYLVSGDADLLVLKKIEHLRILTPKDFVEIL